MPGVYSIVVMRDGRPVLERYYQGLNGAQPFPVFSVTKSVVSALVGIAIGEGHIRGVQQPLSALLELPPSVDPRIRRITLGQLLTMTAGWSDTFASGGDVVPALLERPLARAPGKRWEYDNGSSHLVSAILSRATGRSAADYAREKLFGPLQIEPFQWLTDPQGISSGSSGLVLTARELARLGELYRRGGRWKGRQLVPEQWVRDSTRKHVGTDDPNVGYGYYWWIGERTKTFAALGVGGQVVSVAPREHAVVVVTSNPETPPDTRRLLAELILPAVRG